MAGFTPQANLPFVGAYVAKEKGFFEEEGLDVDIQHSSGGSQHIQLLMAGQVQFTTADAANVLQRIADPGLPLVAIALIGQTGQQGWVTLAGSGLDDPADWKGKTVGYRNTVPPDLLAILKARRPDPRRRQRREHRLPAAAVAGRGPRRRLPGVPVERAGHHPSHAGERGEGVPRRRLRHADARPDVRDDEGLRRRAPGDRGSASWPP